MTWPEFYPYLVGACAGAAFGCGFATALFWLVDRRR